MVAGPKNTCKMANIVRENIRNCQPLLDDLRTTGLPVRGLRMAVNPGALF